MTCLKPVPGNQIVASELKIRIVAVEYSALPRLPTKKRNCARDLTQKKKPTEAVDMKKKILQAKSHSLPTPITFPMVCPKLDTNGITWTLTTVE